MVSSCLLSVDGNCLFWFFQSRSGGLVTNGLQVFVCLRLHFPETSAILFYKVLSNTIIQRIVGTLGSNYFPFLKNKKTVKIMNGSLSGQLGIGKSQNIHECKMTGETVKAVEGEERSTGDTTPSAYLE